jgi:transcriptional/translational regulatory protein YebC/TACO1
MSFARRFKSCWKRIRVSFLFAERGQILLDTVDADVGEDAVLEAALEGGAQDVRVSDGTFEVLCAAHDLETLQNALLERGFKIEAAAVADIPLTTVRIEEPDTARKVLRLLMRLDELDDVQKVAANFDVPDELLVQIDTTL